MILVLEKGITQDQKSNIRSILFGEGYIVREMSEAGQTEHTVRRGLYCS